MDKNKEKAKARRREREKTPEFKERRRRHRQIPEVKAKRKKYCQSHGVKAQTKGYRERPEIKARRVIYSKNYRKKNKDELKIKRRNQHENSKKSICIICGEPALEFYCSNKCNGIGTRMEKNPQWRGGKSFEPYNLSWTKELRQKIRRRDAYLCMMCDCHQDEIGRSHSIHHIDGDKDNCKKDNLISLCHRHHMVVEKGGKAQTFWQPKFQKMLSKLYGYEYE